MEALVSAALVGPVADLEGDGAPTVLRERLETLRAAEERLLDLVTAEVFSVAEIASKRQQIMTEVAEVHTELDAYGASAAQADLLTETWRHVWSGGTVSLAHAARVKADIRQRIEVLEMDRLRAVIHGSLVVTVHRGRGSGRVKVRHLRATGLN